MARERNGVESPTTSFAVPRTWESWEALSVGARRAAFDGRRLDGLVHRAWWVEDGHAEAALGASGLALRYAAVETVPFTARSGAWLWKVRTLSFVRDAR